MIHISLFSRKAEEKKIRQAFSKIKDEMSDHLDAINENTNELNSTNEYVAQVEEMVNKLSERLDDIELKLAEFSGRKTISEDDFKHIILTSKEQEVFYILYSRTGDLIDYREISKSLGLTEELARKHVSSIINKGIPIIKKYFENKTYLVLDSDFRNLQAKKNLIKIKQR
jgi:hypothetical protein